MQEMRERGIAMATACLARFFRTCVRVSLSVCVCVRLGVCVCLCVAINIHRRACHSKE